MADIDDAARALVRAIIEQIPEDKSLPDTPTLNEAIEEFVALKRANTSGRNADTYEHRLGTFAEVYGAVKVADIEQRDVARYVAHMRGKDTRYEDHPYHPTEYGSLSPATIDGRIQSLKSFFSWCEKRGYCAQSPAEGIKRRGYDPASHSRAMEPETLKAMVAVARQDAVQKEKPRGLALLLFLADTAVRVGELISMRLGNLDTERLCAVVSGKSGEREVYFTEATGRALEYWLSERPDCEHDYVFCAIGYRNRGAPLTGNATYITLRRLAVRAGVEDKRFNPHSIRHLVGQVYTDNANLELARKKLGHSSITTTARHYANQDRARMIRATKDFSLVDDESD